MDQKAQVVLVVLVWKSQPWYPVLLNMLWEFPRWILLLRNMAQNPAELDLPRLTLQLAVWPISGRSSVTVAFQRKLQTFFWPPGGPSQSNPITHTSENGLAGVLHGTQILFQDL